MAQNLGKRPGNKGDAERALFALTIFFDQDVLVENSGLLHPPSATLPRKIRRAARTAKNRQNSPFWPILDTLLKLFLHWFRQFSQKLQENEISVGSPPRQRFYIQNRPSNGSQWPQMEANERFWDIFSRFGPLMTSRDPLFGRIFEI